MSTSIKLKTLSTHQSHGRMLLQLHHPPLMDKTLTNALMFGSTSFASLHSRCFKNTYRKVLIWRESAAFIIFVFLFFYWNNLQPYKEWCSDICNEGAHNPCKVSHFTAHKQDFASEFWLKTVHCFPLWLAPTYICLIIKTKTVFQFLSFYPLF